MDDIAQINIEKLEELNIKIQHKYWMRAYREAYTYMATADPGDVISICGASHVGKSYLAEELIMEFSKGAKLDSDDMPIVKIVVDNNSAEAKFSYREFILDLLDILKHPVYCSDLSDPNAQFEREKRIGRVSNSELVRALRSIMKIRKVRYLVADEAQNIKYAGKSVMASVAVMDALKALAHKAKVVLVVCGTYSMLHSICRSGHLENRKYDVHLRRYRKTNEDREEFAWILSHYDAVLDLDKSLETILNCAELLYKASLGCIGVVKKIIHAAIVLARSELSKVGMPHIERAVKSSSLTVANKEEIRVGEMLFGMGPATSGLDDEESNAKVDRKLITKAKSKAKSKTKRKPFQRNPKRFEKGNRI